MFQIYNFQTMIEKILKSATMDRLNAIPLIMPFHSFSIGHFDTEETVTIRMSFPENSTVSFDTPEFLLWILTNTHKLSLAFVSKKLLFTKEKQIGSSL